MSGSAPRLFLLEIGCEELPDGMIAPALAYLSREFRSLVERERLGAAVPDPPELGTPRRLALRMSGVADRQPDREVEVVGPRAEAAFDKDGRPTRALEGFARAQGVAVAELVRVPSAKGECMAARRREAGRSAAEVLAAALPGLIASTPFGKTMRWGSGSYRFARPIHWIVCLLGSEVIRFEVAGIVAGRSTRGARFRGAPPIEIADARDYVERLRGEGVVVDIAERRRRVSEAVAEECRRRGGGGQLETPPGLIEGLVHLTEHPVAAGGGFDPSFLALPGEVLATAMVHHQRFFPVRASDGTLAPHYVAVLNCPADPATIDRIRRGNEWVLRARLRDAGFFWAEDQKRGLEDRLPDLDRVLFEATLGSYRRKVERLAGLAGALGETLAAGGAVIDRPALEEAARLSKSDLTTLMVKEFPELQGVMGALYGRKEGRAEAVCRALEQQYRGAGEAGGRSRLETPEGAALVVVDRIDTLVGFFLLGKIPTGSRDPIGLRRAALALIQAALDQNLRFDLHALIERARALYAGQGVAPGGNGLEKLGGFLEERLRHVAQEGLGLRYDAVSAGLAVGFSDLVDARRRIEALDGIRGHADFEALSLSYRRVRNILAGQPAPEGEPEGLEPEEAALAAALAAARKDAEPALAAGDYPRALGSMAGLRAPLDRFFEQVLVMDPDSGRRARRLGLLAGVSRLFRRVGDFAEMVREGDSAGEPAREVERG